jgi:hypothetical protein
MEIILVVLLGALLMALVFKLVGWLINALFGLLLGTVKVLFILVCLASFLYFAIQFSPVF